MKETRHLFWSATGEMLPRWREAFSNLLCPSFDSAVSLDGTPLIVWLRLSPKEPVEGQVATARKQVGTVPIIVLSDAPNDQEALAAFAAAARGYCNSHATAEILLQVANVVQQGGLWIGESLMQRLIRATNGASPIPGHPPSDWESKLTEREREVARVVASGASNKEVARQLGITERTVKAHLTTILEKLGVRDRLQLALAVHQK